MEQCNQYKQSLQELLQVYKKECRFFEKCSNVLRKKWKRKQRTLIPSHRETARSGRSARSVRNARNGPMLPIPIISAPRLTKDIYSQTHIVYHSNGHFRVISFIHLFQKKTLARILPDRCRCSYPTNGVKVLITTNDENSEAKRSSIL